MLDRMQRLLGRTGKHDRACFVCGSPVRDGESRIRLRGETVVHGRCATYRMRRARSGSERLGFPPR